jgi:hypothetical protein
MVPPENQARRRSGPATTEGEGAGAVPDQFGPVTVEEVREAMASIGVPLNRIKDRYTLSSPTYYTDTIHDLVDAIEQLAGLTARQYGADALYGHRSDESPEPEE